jgi:DNA-directed RNA polymerase specialized sigma24 family protein
VRDAVLSVLLVLDEAKREVVLLHDLEGWAHWQIAEALGIGESDSRQQLFDARRILHGLGKLGAPQGRGTTR